MTKATIVRTTLLGSLLILLVALLVWLGYDHQGQPETPDRRPVPAGEASSGKVLRLALIPERDIFEQRRIHRLLGDYLAGQLGQPVEFVTLNTYQGVLQEFAEKQIDGAFLGSMVTVLAADRYGAHVLVRPEYPGGVSTYHGVIIVREDSPITRIDQLAGQSLAMLRTTTAGNLFPIYLLIQEGLLKPEGSGDQRPQFRWVGTHDEVIREVVEGRVAAGALKNLRLDAFEQTPGHAGIRRLAHSQEVPSNTLVMRGDAPEELLDNLARILLSMEQTAEGRQALAAFGAQRFLPTRLEEYKPIYDMVDALGPAWEQLGVTGPAPRWNRTSPSSEAPPTVEVQP